VDPLLLGTATAFGLAASAGLNTTLPLLIVGLLARFGLLALNAPFDALASDVTLGGLFLLAVLEFGGDKVPGLDSIVHAVQWPLAAAAGAILFASQASVVSWVSPELAILVGLLTAGAVHGIRAAARPVVTGLTLGTGNTALSVAEDGSALLLAAASVLAPAVAVVLMLLLLVPLAAAATWAVRRGLRLSSRPRSPLGHAR
jgi:hypothetical protein